MIQIKAEKKYMYYFQDRIDCHVLKIKEAVEEELSEAASDGIALAFYNETFRIVQNTADEMCSQIAAKENPFAALDPRLCTKKQREDAAEKLIKQLEDKTAVFPAALLRIVDERLILLENSVSEIFRNLQVYKQKICRELFEGAEYSAFTEIQIGSGDFHCEARSTAILSTDIGKMIYKPRPSVMESSMGEFVRKYFPDSVIVPKCFTDGEQFGVSEFLTKQTTKGEAAARKWYYSMGELSAMCSLLDSTDMHYENIFSVDTRPALIDMETMLTPRKDAEDEDGFTQAVKASVIRSGLMPRTESGIQASVLFNTTAEGSAPLVNDEPVTVLSYEKDYFEGFRSGYSRILSMKYMLEQDIQRLFSASQIRILFLDSHFYGELITSSYRKKYMSEKGSEKKREEELESALTGIWKGDKFRPLAKAETRAILRGDIPRFYTYGNSTDLYADGQVIAANFLKRAA